MKFSFYQVTPDDLEELNKKDCFSMGEIGCAEDLLALAMHYNSDSICMGFGDSEGRLYGICGSYRQWKGAAQLWAIFDKEVDNHPLSLTKACMQLIEYARKKQDLRRVSFTVKSDYNKGNRFADVLGFAFEGKMYGFLPCGSDANLYARLF